PHDLHTAGSAPLRACSPPLVSKKRGPPPPPYLNPPVGSSSGPPGACMTPSRDTNAVAMTLLMVPSPSLRLRYRDDERNAPKSTTTSTTAARNFLPWVKRGRRVMRD